LPAAIGVLALSLGSTSVSAATATTTFQVSTDVQATCSISAAAMDFGNYTSDISLPAVAVNGSINLVCSDGTIWSVGLNAGLGAGATVTSRSMTGPGAALLRYRLLSDPARTVNWGNTVGVDTVAGTGTGTPQPIIVYGQLPANQSVLGGTYTDMIVATLTF
jgi:spore coat protein U-like protein